MSWSCRAPGLSRRGATVLEVMFAIFVVIVGLMGIASLIPLAARNAEQSNAYNRALAQGQIWLNDVLARGINRPDMLSRRGTGFNWQWYNDFATNVNGVNIPVGFYNFNRAGIQSPSGAVVPGSGVTPNNAAVSSLACARTWSQQSVCIDPVFMSDPDVVRSFNSGNGRYGSYRASVFPYFEHGHNPMEDAFAAASNPWQDQPRMLRVTLGGGGGRIPNKLVKDLFVSRDDIATFISDEDNSLPASRLFSSDGAKSLTTGDYSWLATMSPEPTTGMGLATPTSDYVLSLVIMQRRDKQYIQLDPNNPPLAGSADNKPQGERLVWVQPLSGDFRGGNGGRVRLISNRDVEDRLYVGDWVMFGKHFAINPLDTTQRFSYFRWFRIIAIDADPKISRLQDFVPSGDPYGNSGNQLVWSREVVVEGPDWTFFSTPDPSGATLGLETIVTPSGAIPVPTTGTLMSNVVTVIERNVTLD